MLDIREVTMRSLLRRNILFDRKKWSCNRYWVAIDRKHFISSFIDKINVTLSWSPSFHTMSFRTARKVSHINSISRAINLLPIQFVQRRTNLFFKCRWLSEWPVHSRMSRSEYSLISNQLPINRNCVWFNWKNSFLPLVMCNIAATSDQAFTLRFNMSIEHLISFVSNVFRTEKTKHRFFEKWHKLRKSFRQHFGWERRRLRAWLQHYYCLFQSDRIISYYS